MTEEFNENAITDTTESAAAINAMRKIRRGETASKRIDFDAKTMRRLNTMLPLYKEEVGERIKESELYSYVVNVAINTLFEGEFKKKLDEL